MTAPTLSAAEERDRLLVAIARHREQTLHGGRTFAEINRELWTLAEERAA